MAKDLFAQVFQAHLAEGRPPHHLVLDNAGDGRCYGELIPGAPPVPTVEKRAHELVAQVTSRRPKS